jgi:hypothetical protein
MIDSSKYFLLREHTQIEIFAYSTLRRVVKCREHRNHWTLDSPKTIKLPTIESYDTAKLIISFILLTKQPYISRL